MASRGDRELLYRWQIQPETRRFARDPRVPSEAEHQEWMDRVLADPGIMLTVVMHGDEPAGVLRLDVIDGATVREVSIYVAPEKHRHGIGKAALRLARETFPSWTLHAEVHPDNRASHTLFQKAGYRSVSDTRYVSDPLVAEVN